MPDITINNSTFERLQRHARPFVNTPDAVIIRALDALENSAARLSGEAAEAAPERIIDSRSLPNLTHTKVLSAAVNRVPVARPNWNRLLDEILRLANKRAGSFENLRKICPVNMVKGRKEDEGYSYLTGVNISVQGQDANGACRSVVSAAHALGLALDIDFMWRLKEAAAFPGERARIRIGGTKRESGSKTA